VTTIEPHENPEWRSGLAENGLYHRDRTFEQTAPLRSAICADNAGHPGDCLYNGEFQPLQGYPAPKVNRYTTTAFAGSHILIVVTLLLRSVN
jgi:hypothetical protein